MSALADLPEISALGRTAAASARYGVVADVLPGRCAVTVTFPDLGDAPHGPYPVLQPAAGPATVHRSFSLPAAGTTVVVVPVANGHGAPDADADGPTDCFVLGSVYAADVDGDIPGSGGGPGTTSHVWPDTTRFEYTPEGGQYAELPLPTRVLLSRLDAELTETMEIVVAERARIASGEGLTLGDGGHPVALGDRVVDLLLLVIQRMNAHFGKPPAEAHPDLTGIIYGPHLNMVSEHTETS